MTKVFEVKRDINSLSLDCFDGPSSFCYLSGRLLWCFGCIGVLLRAILRELCPFRGCEIRPSRGGFRKRESAIPKLVGQLELS